MGGVVSKTGEETPTVDGAKQQNAPSPLTTTTTTTATTTQPSSQANALVDGNNNTASASVLQQQQQQQQLGASLHRLVQRSDADPSYVKVGDQSTCDQPDEDLDATAGGGKPATVRRRRRRAGSESVAESTNTVVSHSTSESVALVGGRRTTGVTAGGGARRPPGKKATRRSNNNNSHAPKEPSDDIERGESEHTTTKDSAQCVAHSATTQATTTALPPGNAFVSTTFAPDSDEGDISCDGRKRMLLGSAAASGAPAITASRSQQQQQLGGHPAPTQFLRMPSPGGQSIEQGLLKSPDDISSGGMPSAGHYLTRSVLPPLGADPNHPAHHNRHDEDDDNGAGAGGGMLLMRGMAWRGITSEPKSPMLSPRNGGGGSRPHHNVFEGMDDLLGHTMQTLSTRTSSTPSARHDASSRSNQTFATGAGESLKSHNGEGVGSAEAPFSPCAHQHAASLSDGVQLPPLSGFVGDTTPASRGGARSRRLSTSSSRRAPVQFSAVLSQPSQNPLHHDGGTSVTTTENSHSTLLTESGVGYLQSPGVVAGPSDTVNLSGGRRRSSAAVAITVDSFAFPSAPQQQQQQSHAAQQSFTASEGSPSSHWGSTEADPQFALPGYERRSSAHPAAGPPPPQPPGVSSRRSSTRSRADGLHHSTTTTPSHGQPPSSSSQHPLLYVRGGGSTVSFEDLVGGAPGSVGMSMIAVRGQSPSTDLPSSSQSGVGAVAPSQPFQDESFHIVGGHLAEDHTLGGRSFDFMTTSDWDESVRRRHPQSSAAYGSVTTITGEMSLSGQQAQSGAMSTISGAGPRSFNARSHSQMAHIPQTPSSFTTTDGAASNPSQQLSMITTNGMMSPSAATSSHSNNHNHPNLTSSASPLQQRAAGVMAAGGGLPTHNPMTNATGLLALRPLPPSPAQPSSSSIQARSFGSNPASCGQAGAEDHQPSSVEDEADKELQQVLSDHTLIERAVAAASAAQRSAAASGHGSAAGPLRPTVYVPPPHLNFLQGAEYHRLPSQPSSPATAAAAAGATATTTPTMTRAALPRAISPNLLQRMSPSDLSGVQQQEPRDSPVRTPQQQLLADFTAMLLQRSQQAASPAPGGGMMASSCTSKEDSEATSSMIDGFRAMMDQRLRTSVDDGTSSPPPLLFTIPGGAASAASWLLPFASAEFGLSANDANRLLMQAIEQVARQSPEPARSPEKGTLSPRLPSPWASTSNLPTASLAKETAPRVPSPLLASPAIPPPVAPPSSTALPNDNNNNKHKNAEPAPPSAAPVALLPTKNNNNNSGSGSSGSQDVSQPPPPPPQQQPPQQVSSSVLPSPTASQSAVTCRTPKRIPSATLLHINHTPHTTIPSSNPNDSAGSGPNSTSTTTTTATNHNLGPNSTNSNNGVQDVPFPKLPSTNSFSGRGDFPFGGSGVVAGIGSGGVSGLLPATLGTGFRPHRPSLNSCGTSSQFAGSLSAQATQCTSTSRGSIATSLISGTVRSNGLDVLEEDNPSEDENESDIEAVSSRSGTPGSDIFAPPMSTILDSTNQQGGGGGMLQSVPSHLQPSTRAGGGASATTTAATASLLQSGANPQPRRPSPTPRPPARNAMNVNRRLSEQYAETINNTTTTTTAALPALTSGGGKGGEASLQTPHDLPGTTQLLTAGNNNSRALGGSATSVSSALLFGQVPALSVASNQRIGGGSRGPGSLSSSSTTAAVHATRSGPPPANRPSSDAFSYSTGVEDDLDDEDEDIEAAHAALRLGLRPSPQPGSNGGAVLPRSPHPPHQARTTGGTTLMTAGGSQSSNDSHGDHNDPLPPLFAQPQPAPPPQQPPSSSGGRRGTTASTSSNHYHHHGSVADSSKQLPLLDKGGGGGKTPGGGLLDLEEEGGGGLRGAFVPVAPMASTGSSSSTARRGLTLVPHPPR